jgi:hypothetical protein
MPIVHKEIINMVTIKLPEKTEAWLTDEATRRGIDVSKFAAEIIETAAPKPSINDPTIALMNQLMQEEATDDPEELARREKEGEEFMQNLARNRFEMEGPNARNLWP